MLELACREIVFHFNKHSINNPGTPSWTIMTKGKTYYVDHVSANMSWTTKETPDNPSTKGSIKFKQALLRIENNCAEISALTFEDRMRINKTKVTRIIFKAKNAILWFLQQQEIEHRECRLFNGACGSVWYVLELAEDDLTTLAIAHTSSFRILMENEWYYENYEKGKIVEIDADYQGKIEKLEDLDEQEDWYEN